MHRGGGARCASEDSRVSGGREAAWDARATSAQRALALIVVPRSRRCAMCARCARLRGGPHTEHALRLLLAVLHHRGEAEVADLDLCVVAVYENVLALEVPVDDPRLVQERQPIEHLPAPLLDDLALDALGLVDVPERAAPRE
jgi:hypothetical protein